MVSTAPDATPFYRLKVAGDSRAQQLGEAVRQQAATDSELNAYRVVTYYKEIQKTSCSEIRVRHCIGCRIFRQYIPTYFESTKYLFFLRVRL